MGVVIERRRGKVKAYIAGGQEIVRVQRFKDGGILYLRNGKEVYTDNKHLVEILIKRLEGNGR